MENARTRVRGPGWIIAIGLVLAVGLAAQDAPTGAADGGNQIWVAHSRGVSAVDTADGHTSLELAIQTGARAVVVDSDRDLVWTLAQQSLFAHTRAGIPLYQAEIPSPRGELAFLDIDRDAGTVWVATHSQVLAFDAAGQMLVRHRLPKQLTAGALDSARGQYWYGFDDTVGTIDAAGVVLRTIRLPGIKSIAALAYAAENDTFWVLADDELLQLSSDGGVGAPVANGRLFSDLALIAADGAGGLWAADKRNVYRLDFAVNLLTAARPFEDESPEAVQALQAVTSDGTAWVASQRTIAHLDVDGTILLRAIPGDEKTRNIAGIALDEADAAPRIQFTSPDDGSFLNDNRPEFRVTFAGTDIDSGTLAFFTGDAALAVTCSIEPATAQCIPQSGLADGEVVVSATIASSDGKVSQPAEVRFTVDTVAPRITVEEPTQGFLTNSTQLTVHGTVDEPAIVKVNGNDATLENLNFSYGPTNLVEGTNTFEVMATDRAGNSTIEIISGVLDTIPPSPPNQALIQVTASGGTLVVTGSAGSVEGGATVTLRNSRTGETVTVIAHADGSFSASLAGQPGDEVEIWATDAAGNDGEAIVIEVPEQQGPEPDPRFTGPLAVLAVTPANNAAIASQSVVVVVDLQAPPNTGVVVNGERATPLDNAGTRRYYAHVQLVPGANDLHIEVFGQDGRTLSEHRQITSTALDSYLVSVFPEGGIAPAEFELEVDDYLGRGIWEVEVDFESNGTVDMITEETTFNVPVQEMGLHTVTVGVFDHWGDSHAVSVPIILADPALAWGDVHAVWGALNDTLREGDTAGALQYLTEAAKESYLPVFEELADSMPEIIDSYSDLLPSFISDELIEGGINRTIDGIQRVFMITFVKDDRGMWQLDSM